MDDTLREGAQTPGVDYTPEARLRIFERLYKTGFRMINVGSPSVQADRDGIRKIVGLGYGDAEVIGHLRCMESDVESAIECGLRSVKLYISPTKDHLEAKYKERFGSLEERRDFCLKSIESSVSRAKQSGEIGTISYTPEDMTGAVLTKEETEFAYKAIQTAIDCGAKRISLPDTRGMATPEDIRKMVRGFKERFGDVETEGHFHNDFQLSVANSLAAIQEGVGIIHTTFNGLGERAGITPVAPLVASLYKIGVDAGLNLAEIYSTSKYVESVTRFPLARNAPIVGETAFEHTAGGHQQGVVNNKMTYQPIDESLFGRHSSLSFGTMTSRSGMRGFMKECGIPQEEIEGVADKVTDQVREFRRKEGVCSPNDVKRIVESSLGRTIDMPRSYLENTYYETRFDIKARPGADEKAIMSLIEAGMSDLPYIYSIREVIGSSDYSIDVRYNGLHPDAPKRIRKMLTSIRGVESIDLKTLSG